MTRKFHRIHAKKGLYSVAAALFCGVFSALLFAPFWGDYPAQPQGVALLFALVCGLTAARYAFAVYRRYRLYCRTR